MKPSHDVDEPPACLLEDPPPAGEVLPGTIEGDPVLPPGPRLSAEAERLRSWFGLPISLLPVPRAGGRRELQDFVLDVNHLIAGRIDRLLPWEALAAAFPAAVLDGLQALLAPRFSPLWSEEESAELRRRGAPEVHADWRRRCRAGDWAPALGALLDDADLPRIWSELGTGDFDVTGRGNDYTRGMHYFQAARAMGVETLLDHVGAFGWEDGLLLDVLGGDGYILRLFEALRKLRGAPLAVGECGAEGLLGELSGEAAGAGRRLAERCGGALVLALERGEPGGGDPPPTRAARWLAVLPTGVVASAPLSLPAETVLAFDRRAVSLPGGRNLDDLLGQAEELLPARPAAAAGPRVITNDISPHMFFSAGLWGLPTREDACRLSRTFRAGALDAVIFAYGTHHVAGIGQAIRETFAVLRPGGQVVLQDFLDEGPVGDWFHRVVDPYSRTGHDFDHIGPIQLAVHLLLAGFRDLRLFEMEDPFLFAVPPGSAVEAREVACTYLLGMYGLGDSHLRDRPRLEERIRQTLSYAELGNVPRFEADFVYVPRRATGASAVRPAEGEAAAPSPSDRALVAALGELLALDSEAVARRFGAPPELLRLWFREDGSRWGLAEPEVRSWRELAAGWPPAGGL